MRVLVLSTWFPYPPNQGSTIRAYHLTRSLAQQHEVALVSYEHVPLQPAWLDHMRGLCARVEVVPRAPFASSASRRRLGLLSREPSAVVAIRSESMAARVAQVAQAWQPDLVFAFIFVTAPYALRVPNVRRVVDVDNLTARMLYEEYRAAAGAVERLRRYVAYRKFRSYESRLFRQFDLCLVVSERDRQTLAGYMPVRPGQVGVVPNGVDLDYYTPPAAARAPNSLVYSGALTYQANFDAMEYFLDHIFPTVSAARPDTRLTITGPTEGVDLRRLRLTDRVQLTGMVDDVRPVVGGSQVSVVPLRQGGGTRLKILEAMALGTPVVSTAKGAEGLDVVDGRDLLLADTPGDFAAATLRLLDDPALRSELAANARRRVEACYGWQPIGDHLNGLLAGLER